MGAVVYVAADAAGVVLRTARRREDRRDAAAALGVGAEEAAPVVRPCSSFLDTPAVCYGVFYRGADVFVRVLRGAHSGSLPLSRLLP